MKISLDSVQKKFARQYIFKNVSLTFETANSYALLGANGSGKSTLLRIIGGMQNPSKGIIRYSDYHDRAIGRENIFRYVSYCAPGMELIEEMTLQEFLLFHFRFKPILKTLSVEKIISITGLEKAKNKLLNDFSSGMKQRVKLAQAIFADTPVLLLDEPCSNLDTGGIRQYHNWIEEFSRDRLLIVASNEEREYSFCLHHIHVEQYK